MAFKAHPDFTNGDESESTFLPSDTSILQKHQELRDMTDIRVRTLEATVRQKEMELAHEKESLKTLAVDFEYNLGLIKERDEEIERYEEAVENMKLAVIERDQEIAELKIHSETLQGKVREEQRRFNEMESHYQAQLLTSRTELETARRKFESDTHTKDNEIRELNSSIARQRNELFEEANTQLQAQITQTNTAQQQKEDAWRTREEKLLEQFQAKQDSLTASTLQLQVLEEQTSQSKHREEFLKEQLKECKERLASQAADFETRIKDLQRDALATKKALEDKVTHDDTAKTTLQVDLDKIRHQRMEQEAELSRVKDSNDIKVEHYTKEVDDLRAANSDLKQQLREEQSGIERAREELMRLKESSADASKKEVEARSQEISTMTIDLHKTKMELQSVQTDNQSKKDLIASLHAELQTRKTEIEAATRAASLLKEEHKEVLEKEKTRYRELDEEMRRRREEMQREREVEKTTTQEQLKASEALRRQEMTQKDEALRDMERKLKDHHNHHSHHSYYSHHDLSTSSEYPPVSPLMGYQSHHHHHHHHHHHQYHQKVQKPVSTGLQDELVAQVVDLKEKNKELVEQNGKIRAEVRSFAEAMAAEPIMKKTKQLQEEVGMLRRELSEKKKELAANQAEVLDLHREMEVQAIPSHHNHNGQAEEIAVLKRNSEADKRKLKMYEALLSREESVAKEELDPAAQVRYKRKYEKLKIVSHQLAKENKDLKSRMAQAKQDFKRLVSEKESLLEINNMLRGDFHKLASKDISRHKATALLPSKLVH
eukprot:TRINITY_DN2416_c0_g1_i3.p1 TRINITY_DN2416_c0_g1~~TRINITY_DN2416_c0_g1_i3.p1  ORF type:complete len:784 (+),score=236.12 TRINITY_DN2416_c0_g1_i3:28-2352(+)